MTTAAVPQPQPALPIYADRTDWHDAPAEELVAVLDQAQLWDGREETQP